VLYSPPFIGGIVTYISMLHALQIAKFSQDVGTIMQGRVAVALRLCHPLTGKIGTIWCHKLNLGLQRQYMHTDGTCDSMAYCKPLTCNNISIILDPLQLEVVRLFIKSPTS